MQFITEGHREGLTVAKANPFINRVYQELTSVIESISEEEIRSHFLLMQRDAKSISQSINSLLDQKLRATPGWVRQSRIFKDDIYKQKTWTLDFAKSVSDEKGDTYSVSVEVVFNHREAIAWNLMKLALAAERNHVRKEVEAVKGLGVFICATNALHKAGGFDPSVGDYETVLKYLAPLEQLIPSNLLILGLEPPKTFRIDVFDKNDGSNGKFGKVFDLRSNSYMTKN